MRGVVDRVSLDSLALLDYLERRGDDVRLLDSGPAPWPYPPLAGGALERFRALSAAGRVVTRDGLDPTSYDTIYLDLYTSPLEPYAAAAIEAGKRLSGLADVVLGDSPVPTLGVTGSAGKSTTTAIAAAVLRAAGSVVHMASDDLVLENLWPSHELVPVLDDPGATGWIACELTSAHLEYCNSSPTIAVVTNLFRDHVEWHGTLERYVEAKARILAFQGPGDLAVLGLDDEGSRELAARVQGRVAHVSCVREVEQGAFLRDGTIVLRWDGRETELCALAEVAVAPTHAVNALAAAAAGAGAGAQPEAVAAGLRSHRGLGARLEPVGEAGGVCVYNDGSSMTPAKVRAALEAFPDASLVYLTGGELAFGPTGQLHASPEEREAVLETIRIAAAKSKRVVVYGPSADVLREDLAAAGFTDVHETAALPEGIATAARLAEPGDAILFSPLYYTDLDEVAGFNELARRLALDPLQRISRPRSA